MWYRPCERGGKMPRRRNRYNKHVSLPLILIGLLCILIVYFSYHLLLINIRIDHSTARSVLSMGMPMVGEQEELSPGFDYTVRSIMYALTDFDLGNPESLLKKSIRLFALVDQKPDLQEHSFVFIQELTFAPDPDNQVSGAKAPGSDLSTDPVVLIYHTHSSEMYLGPQAVSTNYHNSHYVFSSGVDQKITGIMEVGNHLAHALRSQGIPVVHETRIHDWPSLTSSYINSERTVHEILRRYDSIEFVFDVHRDACVPDPVVMIDGKRVAKVLIVVGTAQDIPQKHPNWEQNLEFAYEFYRLGEQKYPGLMRPMQVRRDARYNQHLHQNSIILEIGAVENNIEEALLAAELVATLIAEMI